MRSYLGIWLVQDLFHQQYEVMTHDTLDSIPEVVTLPFRSATARAKTVCSGP